MSTWWGDYNPSYSGIIGFLYFYSSNSFYDNLISSLTFLGRLGILRPFVDSCWRVFYPGTLTGTVAPYIALPYTYLVLGLLSPLYGLTLWDKRY